MSLAIDVAKPGTALYGLAWLSLAWTGKEGRGMAKILQIVDSSTRHSGAGYGIARPGLAWQDLAMHL